MTIWVGPPGSPFAAGWCCYRMSLGHTIADSIPVELLLAVHYLDEAFPDPDIEVAVEDWVEGAVEQSEGFRTYYDTFGDLDRVVTGKKKKRFF
ncbi:hypothetical protein CEXT_346801 [Caerostris extrusa]|uniref:Uncharacterized protein n=1 Tax=Caerostris extrusa TaxID=172846 RepID=A0AAV4Q2Z7_CAEEX|nr:hypothetical protein CEXT_346801 [Caerostris extrusa]